MNTTHRNHTNQQSTVCS